MEDTEDLEICKEGIVGSPPPILLVAIMEFLCMLSCKGRNMKSKAIFGANFVLTHTLMLYLQTKKKAYFLKSKIYLITYQQKLHDIIWHINRAQHINIYARAHRHKHTVPIHYFAAICPTHLGQKARVATWREHFIHYSTGSAWYTSLLVLVLLGVTYSVIMKVRGKVNKMRMCMCMRIYIYASDSQNIHIQLVNILCYDLWS